MTVFGSLWGILDHVLLSDGPLDRKHNIGLVDAVLDGFGPAGRRDNRLRGRRRR